MIEEKRVKETKNNNKCIKYNLKYLETHIMLIIKRFTSLSTVNHHIRNYSSRLIKLKSNTSLQNYINQETHDIQWDILRQSLMENELSVNKKNVDGIIVGMCSREKRMDLATAYLKFMRSQNLQPSDASLGKYLRFRYACRRLDVSSESDESDIIEICDYLIEKNERLHAELVENVISGLCLTKNWQKSLQLIRRVADDDQQELSSASYYVPVILKAIKEDDLETTWTLLKEVVDKNFPPSPQIIVDFLNKFADKSEEVEKIFNILNDQSLLLPQNSVEIVKNILSRRYQTSIVNIKNDGVCRHCRGELENISLNKDEFKKLSKNFMDDVFKRKDIFFHTNPQELENFTNFVEETRPYDCVVDGLNVAYSNGQQSNNELLARNVASVVKYFKQNNQHVLVVGRQHMLKWPKKHIDFIKRNSSFFLAQNM